MLRLPGYKITEEIQATARTIVYRGTKERDETPVIIKIPRAEYPTLEDLTRLRQEYTITHNLQYEGIIKSYSLEKYHNGLALILEDIGGHSLKDILTFQKLSIREFLKTAIFLVDTLNYLHKIPIIHKDIKPSNIIVNLETGIVKISDFSIASRLSLENPSFSNPQLLEGTLAYMSPEQTGRMNRSIDYRSDFYCLGATFYEMLTLQLPFTTTDLMELVHCHIAKLPTPPHYINTEIPEPISLIIMKLLAKTAESRYQSAAGLKSDLETCLLQLQTTGKIENFVLGTHDKGNQLLIPQKLYGRESELAHLMDAFNRVKVGATEMMLVSGYSGIGKTSVVNEVHKPIVASRGYFIAGKFDQFKRNTPYTALIQAFSDLIRQLLTENPQNIAVWKNKLLNALGPNGQVIANVIPEIELIIGKQPEIPQLGPTESQNRFNRVFQQFIHVFCQPEHPLVVFLDDLQWADSASLKLIQLLMTDPDSQYFLIIGAYRDNEVNPTHILIQTIDKLSDLGRVIYNITLRPLSINHVNLLVADTLNETAETLRIQPLVELAFSKTQGNPFFLTQLLKTLYAENLLIYDISSGSWQWNIQEIQAIGITDYNVVELIARNISKLPLVTQNLLKQAACIGNQFTLDILAIVNEKSPTDTAVILWDALQSGLVLPLSSTYKIPMLLGSQSSGFSSFEELASPGTPFATNPQVKISYKFLHDRVQQAAYSLIPESEQKATHLKIGQLLLNNTTFEEKKENIFALVNQLNFGTDLLTIQLEKDELASLNLIAGQKAKAATAYEAAANYLNVSLGLLTTNSWQDNYNLTLAIYIEAVEAEYLVTNFDKSKTLAEVALGQAKTLLEKIKVYEIQIQSYFAQNHMQMAVDTALSVLTMLNVSLEEKPPESLIIDDLSELPEISDPYKLAALRILDPVSIAAFVANPSLFPSLVFTRVNLCKTYGNSAWAPMAYTNYAFLLCGVLGDIDSGYRYGELALKLLDKFNAKQAKCKVLNNFNANIRHWKEPVINTIEPLSEAIYIGIETGDLMFAGIATINYCTHILFMGDFLEEVNHKYEQYIGLMSKLKQDYFTSGLKITQQLVQNFLGKSNFVERLEGEAFKESEMLPIFIQYNSFTSLFVVYLSKTITCYLFNNYSQAVENSNLAEPYASAVLGLLYFAEHNFYFSLALLAHYPNASETEKKQFLRKITSNQKKMKEWATHAPLNFQHKYDLVEAERARISGEVLEAMELYDKAIIGAREQGYAQEEAIGNERAAEFYLAIGRQKIAQTYITEAYYSYIRWGATAKVKDLESKYSDLLSRITAQKSAAIDSSIVTASTVKENDGVLDLAAVMKASLSISNEIVLSQLLNKLMNIVITNAGAQKGFLVLNQKDSLVIAASAELDEEDILVSVFPALEIDRVMPKGILNYVQLTQSSIVLNDARNEELFISEPYIIQNQPLSVLCLPIINQGKFIGLLYLENNLTTAAFTPNRLEVLKLLASQAAISLENSVLYTNLEIANHKLEDYNRNLEFKVEERTQELQLKNEELHQTLKQLQQTQTQLIQAERMSSLGQLVAGIAHEINNPVNFIYGNITHTKEYMEDLLRLVDLYQQAYPHPNQEIIEEIDAIDLTFLCEDLPQILSSMNVGAERIRIIVASLQNFARHEQDGIKRIDIHSGIDSTLLILEHRLKETGERPRIQVVKEYGKLPLVECYPGELNQVFMNIISNAIDALDGSMTLEKKVTNERPSIPEEKGKSKVLNIMEQASPHICIRTKVIDDNKVAIRIIDNGPGMNAEVVRQVFDPFFTTKPVGSGTGLGLSISHSIVVQKHGGNLRCISELGQGAEFVIEIPIGQF